MKDLGRQKIYLSPMEPAVAGSTSTLPKLPPIPEDEQQAEMPDVPPEGVNLKTWNQKHVNCKACGNDMLVGKNTPEDFLICVPCQWSGRKIEQDGKIRKREPVPSVQKQEVAKDRIIKKADCGCIRQEWDGVMLNTCSAHGERTKKLEDMFAKLGFADEEEEEEEEEEFTVKITFHSPVL
jgi:hypothetical protein